jgi:hypothetical protein
MKIIISILTGLAFLISIESCQTIGKKMYGIKKPKNETVESVEKYLTSIGVSIDNNIFTKNFNSYKIILKEFGNTLPEAVLFNSEGKKLIYKKNNQDCNAGLFETIPNLIKNATELSIDSSNLSNFLYYLVDRNGNTITELPKADYYLFVNWAIYMGKLNKDHVKVWENLATKNDKAKINVYKINMDMMTNWDVK